MQPSRGGIWTDSGKATQRPGEKMAVCDPTGKPHKELALLALGHGLPGPRTWRSLTSCLLRCDGSSVASCQAEPWNRSARTATRPSTDRVPQTWRRPRASRWPIWKRPTTVPALGNHPQLSSPVLGGGEGAELMWGTRTGCSLGRTRLLQVPG